MMILVLFLLVALLFKLKRVAISLTALLLFTIFLVGSGILTQWTLTQLQQAPKPDLNWKASNLFIVLGSGTTRTPYSEDLMTSLPGVPRVFKVARLYFDCKKKEVICKVLLSGGDPRKNGESEAAVMAKELLALNIPGEDILLEDKSSNTFLNAKFSKGFLKTKDPFEKIFLITSGTHLKRSLLYFEHFGIRATGIASDNLQSDFSLMPKSSNVYLLDIALHEYIGILRYHFYNFMKWNEPKVINE